MASSLSESVLSLFKEFNNGQCNIKEYLDEFKIRAKNYNL
jgi:hypothetical protein